jgi:hypothetical protein
MSGLQIDLAGIPEEFWHEREERCAGCRQFLDKILDEDGEEAVPLLLWRENGREMLRLCWPCATKRMTATALPNARDQQPSP